MFPSSSYMSDKWIKTWSLWCSTATSGNGEGIDGDVAALKSSSLFSLLFSFFSVPLLFTSPSAFPTSFPTLASFTASKVSYTRTDPSAKPTVSHICSPFSSFSLWLLSALLLGGCVAHAREVAPPKGPLRVLSWQRLRCWWNGWPDLLVFDVVEEAGEAEGWNWASPKWGWNASTFAAAALLDDWNKEKDRKWQILVRVIARTTKKKWQKIKKARSLLLYFLL